LLSYTGVRRTLNPLLIGIWMYFETNYAYGSIHILCWNRN